MLLKIYLFSILLSIYYQVKLSFASAQNRFAGLLTQVTAFMGAGGAESVEAMITKLEQLKGLIDQVHNQIRNPEKTTFVCVCIPEFLSIYETERLVQELSKSEIDTHNVVVNQVLFPDKDAEDLVEWYAGAKATLPQEAQDLIGKTISRKRMQDRYISQIFELYEDFHITLMPLLDNEVIYCHCFFNSKYSVWPYTLKSRVIQSHVDYLDFRFTDLSMVPITTLRDVL